jgi:hypothetical protein
MAVGVPVAVGLLVFVAVLVWTGVELPIAAIVAVDVGVSAPCVAVLV